MSETKIAIKSHVSDFYIDQLDTEEKKLWDAYIAKWEGHIDPVYVFLADYDYTDTPENCAQIVADHWDSFQDVFHFTGGNSYIIGHPLKRLAYDLGITDPLDFLNVDYLVMSGARVDPRHSAIALATNFSDSFTNNIILAVQNVLMTDGSVYKSFPIDDYGDGSNRLQLVFTPPPI